MSDKKKTFSYFFRQSKTKKISIEYTENQSSYPENFRLILSLVFKILVPKNLKINNTLILINSTTLPTL